MITSLSSSEKSAGFTLLEMLGVMAIVSILASIAIPSIVTRINRANSSKESLNLSAIGEALRERIRLDRVIPDESTWAQVAAEQLLVPLAWVTTSVGQQPRVYMWDPSLSIGGQAGVLPYAQSSQGSADKPGNLRIIVVSSQFLPLPPEIASGVASSQEEFDALWELPRNALPDAWPAAWDGRGDELHVQRLDLTSLFHRVVINNAADGVGAEVSVDGSAAQNVPPTGLSGYYFEGSEIALLKSGEVDSRHRVDRDLSYVYERGIWRGRLWEGRQMDATPFAAALDRFRLSRKLVQANADQQLVVDAYYNYSLVYSAWARAGFPTYNGNDLIIPIYASLLAAQEQLDALSANLILQ
ncbi:MAG: type II secretion system protein [Verrucomicrobiales bacterium]